MWKVNGSESTGVSVEGLAPGLFRLAGRAVNLGQHHVCCLPSPWAPFGDGRGWGAVKLIFPLTEPVVDFFVYL